MQYLDNMAKQLISESKLATIIEESIKRHLNEAFKSSKLKNFAREHGGLVQGNWIRKSIIEDMEWVVGIETQLITTTISNL